MKFKFIDLFAGIGGFHIAAKKSNYEMECVLACEIDDSARRTYLDNFPNTNMVEDVNDIDTSTMPDFDVLFAGFPCQSFSNAGRKRGFKDPKNGNLFFQICIIADAKKPKFMLLENVKGILSNDNGETIKTINNYIHRLGYVTTKTNMLINSKDVGCLQNRERVYFLCVRKDLVEKKYLPEPELKNVKNRLNVKPDKIIPVDEELNKVIDAWGDFIKNIKRPEGRTLPVIWIDEMMEPKDKDFNKFPNWKKKYINDMKLIYKENKDFIDDWYVKNNVKCWSVRNKKLEWQVGKDEYDINNSMLQLRQSGLRFSKLDSFPALVAMVQIPINVKERRFYSLKEMAKIQTFPANYKFTSNYNKSLKQLGNSVTVEVIVQLINYLISTTEN